MDLKVYSRQLRADEFMFFQRVTLSLFELLRDVDRDARDGAKLRQGLGPGLASITGTLSA